MTNKKPERNGALLTALLYILAGLLFCIFRTTVLSWLMTVIGALLVVSGVLHMLDKRMTEGVVTAAVGILILLGGWLFVDIILLVLGIALTAKGVLDLARALDVKNNISGIAAAIITMLVGVALIVSKWALLDWLFIILGVVLIVDGVLIALGKKD